MSDADHDMGGKFSYDPEQCFHCVEKGVRHTDDGVLLCQECLDEVLRDMKADIRDSLAHKIVKELYNTNELKCNDLRVLPEIRSKVQTVIDKHNLPTEGSNNK